MRPPSRGHLVLAMAVGATSSAAAPPVAPPPIGGNYLGAPPPPPPALVAGLRSLLDMPGCNAACGERAEDWFEQAARWGATSVESMVRLGLTDPFVAALAIEAEYSDEVRRRLAKVNTALAPGHDEL